MPPVFFLRFPAACALNPLDKPQYYRYNNIIKEAVAWLNIPLKK